MTSPAARAQAARDGFDRWWSDEGYQLADCPVAVAAKCAYLKAYIDALELTKQDLVDLCVDLLEKRRAI